MQSFSLLLKAVWRSCGFHPSWALLPPWRLLSFPVPGRNRAPQFWSAFMWAGSTGIFPEWYRRRYSKDFLHNFTTATARGDLPFGILSLFARPKLDPCWTLFRCSSFSSPLSVHSKSSKELSDKQAWQWSREHFGLKCSRICTVIPFLIFPYPW